MKIYIAGKITGDPRYRTKFEEYAASLSSLGHTVMNPAVLPEGFPWESYMPICFAMINACEAVCMLPDWQDSKGARLEREYAEKNGKQINYLGMGGST